MEVFVQSNLPHLRAFGTHIGDMIGDGALIDLLLHCRCRHRRNAEVILCCAIELPCLDVVQRP